MNWPGMNASRGCVRSGLFHSGAFESPRCSMTLFCLSMSVTRPCRSGMTTRPFSLVEMARQAEALDEVDVRAVEREPLQPVVAPIRDDEDRRRRRACRPRCRAAR